MMNNCIDLETQHEQTALNRRGQTVLVDSKMASLLMLMWYHDIDTNFSCQGFSAADNLSDWGHRDQLAYISMPYTEVSKDFILVVMEEFVSFDLDSTTRWRMEFDNHVEQGKRMIIRFPHDEISRLFEFLSTM